MKTIIHEGIAATVHYGEHGQIDLDFNVLPEVGNHMKIGSSTYGQHDCVVTKIEHQVLICDNGPFTYIHIYTEEITE